MKKEEIRTFAQKLFELKDPILVPMLAPKLARFAPLIYIIGLVLLAIGILGAFVAMFSSFSGALLGLVYICIQFVLLRMFCEFLLSAGNQQ
ncbi:MAG: hypothetical protein IJC11_06095 [Alphaproteobacteria bacterium]|nr:hypothetical protein [Alphaproteobacteria bacterium]MBQ3117872.1 hypothetical protein [Alphaproteobacteria bacterium]MBQ6854884.1 hypothetical protein [Alphaproteobacteria bacterium]MBQ8557205.1 hypothetical protein [Alphaproteobacteria bacterium]MBR3913173.1 hypothetical protein [Alphaproteobacteria bacterium]